VFENRVFRRIFGPKSDEEPGGWRKQHNEEFHKLHSSQSIIRMIKSRRMRWVGHEARRKDKSVKARRKEITGTPRRRWVDNFEIDLREIGWDVGDWIDMAQDRDQWRALVNTVLNLWVP
jgi:hypothetical protein